MVAVSVSTDTKGATRAERFRLVRELGSRAVPAWAALDAQVTGRRALVVVERIARGGEYGDEEIGDWVRDARRLAKLEHPNVAKVREVVIRGDEVLVASDFVDGVRWGELASAASASQLPQLPSLEVTLRIFVDVLGGLGAVHDLRDEQGQPLRLMHGELTPECVIVGSEGVTRIVSACRLRSATARPGRAGSAYLAPEILLADDSADVRADVYSVGVMLWEALSGRPLFPNTQPAAIVTHLLSGRIPKATIPAGHPWAEPLVEIVRRALSVEPDKRFESAAALAAELKRVAALKIAAPARVAAHVRAAFGDGIQRRRIALERGEQAAAPRPPPAPAPVPVVVTAPVVPAASATPVATPSPPPPVVEPQRPSIPGPPMMPTPAALAAPRIPADLAVAAAAMNGARGETISSNPAGGPLTGLAREEAPPSNRKRRGAWLAPLVFGVAMTTGAAFWWAVLKKPPLPPVATVRTPETARSSPAPAIAAPSLTEAPPASPDPTDAPPSPAVVGVVGTVGVAGTSPPPAATNTAAPARPKVTPRRAVDKGKYDPEGI